MNDAPVGGMTEWADALGAILDHVRDRHLETAEQQHRFNVDHGVTDAGKLHANTIDFVDKMIEECRPYLSAFLDDHQDATADELEKLARQLSPGGVHNGGWLASAVYEHMRGLVDDLLLAATIRENWHGGKVGFQFLPLPSEDNAGAYEWQAGELIAFLGDATAWNPRRILTGEDLAFFETLPNRIRVYRGCGGISRELAAAGVCWTTDRRTAEWFAWRSDGDPILVAGWVRKDQVPLVKASELEIVCLPTGARQLKCRKQNTRP